MIRVNKDRFELYNQGRYYGFVRVERIDDKIGNFHIHITKFSHTVLNRMKRDESSLMGYIRQLGYSELISMVDIDHVKHGDLRLWTKFVEQFDFEKPKLYTRRLLWDYQQ